MRYIIDVPEEQQHIYDKKDKVLSFLVMAKNATCNIAIDIDAEPYTEPDRKAIEDEVWEFVDCISRMSSEEGDLCFGFSSLREVTINMTYQEAKSKFEAWLKQKDEIRVGDEVYPVNPKAPRVVTKIENRVAYQMGYAGNMWADDISDLHKTGRHFDEVAELLRKMRGEEE